MTKLSNRHIAFSLNKTLMGFTAYMNRTIALINADTHHANMPTVDKVSGSFAHDFTSFSIEASTIVSSHTRPYEQDYREDAIQRTVDLFKKRDWLRLLPELLASAYKFEVQSLPTTQTVAVGEDKLNEVFTVTHSITFRVRSCNAVERVVNAYHNAMVKKPDYFNGITIRGTKAETVKVNYEHQISSHNTGYSFDGEQGELIVNHEPLESMLFNKRLLDFSTQNYINSTGIYYIPRKSTEEVILNLHFHTTLEVVMEVKGREKYICVNINEPVIQADNRFFWEDINMIDLLSTGASKTDIKKFLKEKAVTGTKITMFKSHNLKRKIQMANTAKYRTITFIGSLMGVDLIVEISKTGAVKVTNLLGHNFALYDMNKVERITKIVTENLSDLFANDREFASSLFYSLMPKMDVSKTNILFS